MCIRDSADLESGKAAVVKARELVRSRDGEANGAATKLQAVQRGKKATREVEAKKAAAAGTEAAA